MTNQKQDKNVLGTPLTPCSFDPLTGYYRDGCCTTDALDRGSHTVCAIITDQFLNYSKLRGNDLITPRPEVNFPGLKAGDQWCLCVSRWEEAAVAGCAPLVRLESTHEASLKVVTLELLKAFEASV